MPEEELSEVATEAQLSGHSGRLLVKMGGGRHVALIAHDGDVHAIDATCYHMGGPLLHADIEDCGSFGPCVVCPWHRYQISLRTGDSLYQNMSGTVCSKGIKQRVHEAREYTCGVAGLGLGPGCIRTWATHSCKQVVRQDGRIFVRLSPAEGKIESDTYAFKAPPPSSGSLAAPKQRSGEILRSGRAGAAGLRRPLPAGVAGDVARSMRGADGLAPWARSSPRRSGSSP